jgi:hypothetical protein
MKFQLQYIYPNPYSTITDAIILNQKRKPKLQTVNYMKSTSNPRKEIIRMLNSMRLASSQQNIRQDLVPCQ